MYAFLLFAGSEKKKLRPKRNVNLCFFFFVHQIISVRINNCIIKNSFTRKYFHQRVIMAIGSNLVFIISNSFINELICKYFPNVNRILNIIL